MVGDVRLEQNRVAKVRSGTARIAPSYAASPRSGGAMVKSSVVVDEVVTAVDLTHARCVRPK